MADPLPGRAVEVLVQGLGRHGLNAIRRVDGRLAGFTNQQVQRTGGRHPFVLVQECEGKVAPAASAYLAKPGQEPAMAQTVRGNQEQLQRYGPSR